jgi:PAS domain S-box-containing protein
MSNQLHALVIIQKQQDAEIILHHLEAADFSVKPTVVSPLNLIADDIFDQYWDVIIIGDPISKALTTSQINSFIQHDNQAPIFIVSGDLSDDEVETYLKIGVNGFLRNENLLRLGAMVAREIKWKVARSEGGKNRLPENFNKQDAYPKEEVLRQIFDSSVEGFLILTLDGRILEANDAYCRMTGYTLAELRQISVQDIDSQDTEDEVVNRIKRTIATGADRFETMHKRKNGTLLDVEVSISYLPDNDGRLICFCREITERKNNERVLAQRLNRLTKPSNNAEDIQFEDLFDLDVIQEMQDKFADATGVASIITRPDGTPITRESNFCRLCTEIIRGSEKGRLNCYKSDAELGKLSFAGPTVKVCMSGGLWDAGAGIAVDGKHIANWLIGQVRDDTQNEDLIRKYAREIGVDEDESAKAFAEVKSMSKQQFEKVSQSLYIIANQLSTIAYQNLQQARFIDEQQKVKQALLESENRYKVFFDSGPDAVILIDPDTGEFIEANEKTEILLGYTKEELKNLRIFNLDMEKTVEEVYSHSHKITETGLDDFETKLRTKQNDIRNVHVIVRVIEFGDKKYHLSIFRDITERKLAEEALRDSEDQLSMALEVGNAGIWIWNLDADSIFVDSQFQLMIGYELGKFPYDAYQWRDMIHPDDVPLMTAKLDEYLRGNLDVYEIEYRCKTLNADWAWLMSRGKMMRRKREGVSPQIIGIAMNITERKLAEEKIADYQEHLEDLVESRTAELTAINSELEAFSYSVSHDLRAPLRTINGFSNLLSSDYANILNEEGLHYLERIQTASERMGQLIEDLLTLSHITQRDILFIEVNLSKLAERILHDLCAQTPDRTIEISVIPDLIEWADYNLMKIALENMFMNAHKFTANKENACITFGVIEENGKPVYFVKDNGAGFDMEYSDKLFTPFQRLHSKEKYSGTGIGLSIVKRIISRHNGRIWAEAVEGEGATFYFTLGINK